MKVAIIGAGAAGLSCANQLLKAGIHPDIYEKQHTLGSMHNNNGCILRIFNRRFTDPIKYLSKTYGINIKPLRKLNEICMISPNKTVKVKSGRLGYIIVRGEKENSVDHQLAESCNAEIIYDTVPDINHLKKIYDHIVISEGNPDTAKSMGIWHSGKLMRTRVAVVVGKFVPGHITMWLNTEYTGHCYCYLLAGDSKQANLALTAPNVTSTEFENYWKAFLLGAELPYKINETYDSEFLSGMPDRFQIDNMIFTGNAAGLTDDFLGFGLINAIESGALAAKAILEGIPFDRLVKPIMDDVMRLHEYRKVLDSMGNPGFDRILCMIGLPVVKQMIYRNPFFRIHQAVPIVRLYNMLNGRK